MFVVGQCTKCRTRFIFDITGLTIEEAKHFIKNTDIGECPGMHVEVGKMIDYYEIDWSRTFKNIKEAEEYKDSLAA